MSNQIPNFTDKDAFATYLNVDENELKTRVQRLGDAVYISQTTGIGGRELEAAKQRLGIFNWTGGTSSVNQLLNTYGYQAGNNADYYTNADFDPVDQGAVVLSEQWKKAALVEAKIEAEYQKELLTNPDAKKPHLVSNDNLANSAFLADYAATQGSFTTNAIVKPANADVTAEADTKLNELTKDNPFYNAYNKPASETLLNMREWDAYLADDNKEDDNVTISGNDVNIQQMQPTTSPTITPAQVYSPDVDTFKIAPEAVTPYFNPANTSPTSTTTTPAEQFDAGITRQNTAYSARAPQQAQYYQPQTMQEMTDAGDSTSAYALSQVLYRNPNTGHQLYIPHKGGKPISQIPQGYVRINPQGAFDEPMAVYNPVTAGMNAQGGQNYESSYNPIQFQNQGGMIQGFDAGGMPVNGVSDAVGHTSHLDGTPHTEIAPPTSPGFKPENIYGDVSFQDPTNPYKTVTQNAPAYFQTLQNKAAQATINPAATIAPMNVQYMRETDGQGNLMMPGTVLESTAGQALSTAPMVAGDQIAQVSNVTQSTGAINPGAAQANFTQAAPTVKTTMEGLTPAQQQAIARDAEGNPIRDAAGNVLFTSAPTQLIDAQESSTSSVTGLDAATKTGATDVTTPTDRKIQMGSRPRLMADGTVMTDAVGNIMYEPSELISGTGVDQSEVDTAFGTGKVAAASLTGELATLMRDFEGGDTPAWAAGAMRQATAVMNDRGLGASSMAGQAIVQAAMEAALPIAQIEAGNKQQIALFNGEQRAKFLGIEFDQAFQAKVQNAARVSEIANLNFTAKQTIALENSRAANTVNLADMSNRQAVVMAEAAALSQLDMASLSNLQQAAVQNAQNFLQVDMANLTNAQQTAIFKAQTSSQALLSDTAQANAAAQFNATSENQTNQFFSNLATQVSQFNSAQKNAIDQFNAEETNALLEFNSALQNQREMFNSQNYLAVAQANAVWRQNINTANTEAQNLSNAQYAKDVNDLSQKALDDYWQKERDIMSYVFAQAESQADRAVNLLLGEMDLEAKLAEYKFADNAAKTGFVSKLILGDLSAVSVLNNIISGE